ncbi:MAG: hypothetical protein ACOYNC_13160 [Bacteroidales bacterium]
MADKGKLDDFLLLEMSRRNTDMVANLVTGSPELFNELFRIYAANIEPVSRRAAWVMDIVTEKHPEWITSHLCEIIDLLPTFSHDGLKRHSLRILARSPLPGESHLGKLIKISFDWLLSGTEATAAKCHCMDLLYRISLIEPELKKELADTIEWRMNEETAGFKNRAQKMLAKLYFELNQVANS